jgi:gluconate 2-dehydrogenase subunit 3-like protein
MAEIPSQDNVSRRKALTVMVRSAGAAASLPFLRQSGLRPAAACDAAPCASAPAATTEHVPRFFSEDQIKTLDAISERIIPADEHSPGARAARVWEYIDEIVADSQDDTKKLWTDGLASIDNAAVEAQQKKFADCSPDQQTALLERIARNEDRPTTLEERFFVAAKRATVDGYYTSSIGIHQELEYQGNTALADFPGCTHQEHKS